MSHDMDLTKLEVEAFPWPPPVLPVRFGTLRLAMKDPAETARQLSIDNHDLTTFLSMDFDRLQAQAQTLLNKRFHEVTRIIPETTGRLGTEGKALFHAYALTYWPKGHTRHLSDALEFCNYLFKHAGPRPCRAELHRLRFGSSHRRLALHLVGDFVVDGRPRRALQILYRTRDGSPRQVAWVVEEEDYDEAFMRRLARNNWGWYRRLNRL